MVMTKAITMASRGRSTKTDEIMACARRFRPDSAAAFWLLPLSALAFMLDCISALAGPGATAWPGRTRCRPSTITLSPGESPL